MELRDQFRRRLQLNGFYVAGAGAFVAKHAFTDELAFGRPDKDDLTQAEELAAACVEKLLACNNPESLTELNVDGDADAPYYVPKGVDGAPAKFLKAVPNTDFSKCDSCGACARWCPMGSINPEKPWEVTGICIKCQACIRRCTKNAKCFTDEAFLSHVKMLEENYKKPAHNKLFF